MRIVIFSSAFYNYTIELANRLSKNNKILLILPENLPKKNHEKISDTVELYQFKLPNKLFSLNIFTVFFRTLKKINQFKPNLVHFQRTTYALPLLVFFKRYSFVGTFHDFEAHLGEESLFWNKNGIISRFMMLSMLKLSNQIIVHGNSIKKGLIKKYKITPDKVNIINMGAYDVTYFKEFETPHLNEKSNLILFFGRILKYKGLKYLIKAEPIITKEFPNAKIIIAGAGNFEEYERLIINRGNFLIYNKYISEKFGAELFQKSCIVVLPYIDASQSGVVPLAYAFHNPVISTNVGSIKEIVEDTKTGLIVPPKDHKSLANAIIKLLKNKKLRKDMGNNAYKKLNEELSWDLFTEKTMEVYKKVLNSN